MTTENTTKAPDSRERELDVLDCPLAGTVVVEAGAGTGKTYNIESLYIRLVLEREARTSQILVVTFTENAAKELRTRIRARLAEVRQALEASDRDSYEWKNPVDGKLVEKLLANGAERKVLLARSQEALADFDAAPVFTIHGFCRRMLNDHAFESGIRYGQEMRGTPQENIDEAYRNFHRKYLYGNPARAKIWGKLHELQAESLRKATSRLLGRDKKEIEWSADPGRDTLPFQEFLRQMEGSADPDAEKPFPDNAQKTAYLRRIQREVVSFVGKALAEDKEREGFMTFDDLLTKMKERLEDEKNGTRFRDSIRKQFQYAFIDEFQDTDNVQNAIFRILFRDNPAPEQLIFLIGDPKQAIYGFRNGDVFTYLDATKGDGKDTPRRFQLTSNRRSSREFIKALNAMRETREKAAGEDGGFFLQKDIAFPEIRFPEDVTQKQEWRLLRNGADVKAEEDNGNNPLLNYDKRKNKDEISPRMAEEFKAMVEDRKLSIQEPGEAPRPVRYSDIAVLCRKNSDIAETASALRERDIPCVIVKEAPLFGTPAAGLVLKLMNAVLDPGGPALTRLLDLEGFFPAFHVRQLNCLRQQDLPLCQKLRELLQTWRQRSFRAMFSEFLKSPVKDFLGDAAVQTLGIQPGRTMSEVLLDRHDGDKGILSTLLQIQESLHQAVVEQRLGPEGLTRFLQQRIQKAGSEAEEFPLQRTSEENAVQLMTIHKSKGLQFPIVYVRGMLTWKCQAGTGARFHKRAENGRGMEVRFDMTTTTEAKDSAFQKQATLEDAQEALRLFYVAATRARLLCRFLEGSINKNHFFHILQRGDEQCLPPFGNNAKGQDSTAFLSWLQEGASTEAMPAEKTAAPVAEVFSEVVLPRGWCTCSFSSLVSNGGADAASNGSESSREKSADGDSSDLEEDSSPSQDSEDNPSPGVDSEELEENAVGRAPIFRFPRGKLAGTCWHKILEDLDFQQTVESQRDALWVPMLDGSSQLPKNDREEREERIRAFGEMLEGVLETSLPDPADPSKRLGFSLKDVPSDHRRSELRFYFRLKNGIRGRRLADLLGNIPHDDAWAPFRDKEDGWVLNGSLDLLFQNPKDGRHYILDWKTNALDQKMESFGQAGMEGEMQKNFYHLQYLLYTVAFLHACKSLAPGWELTEDSYNALFGGVFYCFLRGVTKSPEDASGFYATRPAFELVQALFDELQPCEAPAGDTQ